MNEKWIDFLNVVVPHIGAIQEEVRRYGIAESGHMSAIIRNNVVSMMMFEGREDKENPHECVSYGDEDFEVGNIFCKDGVVIIPRTRKKGEDGKTGEDQDGEAAEAAAEGPDQGGGA